MAETFVNDSRVIPTRSLYHWKSSRVGDDVVEVGGMDVFDGLDEMMHVVTTRE